MPVAIPNTTATAAYQDFGLQGVYGSGFLFVANGLVDVLYYHGPRGAASPSGPVTLAPGLTPLLGTDADPLGGISIRAAAGNVSTPAQQFFGGLFEPDQSSVGAGSSFTGTLQPSGIITGLGVIAGAIAANGSVLSGTTTCVKGTTGQYVMTFAAPFTTLPVVVASSGDVTGSGATTAFVEVWGVTVNGFNVNTFEQSGGSTAAEDIPFQFHAVIPA